MCVTCGCGGTDDPTLSLHEHDATHEHVHADGTRHSHSHAGTTAPLDASPDTMSGSGRYRTHVPHTDHIHAHAAGHGAHSHSHASDAQVGGKDAQTIELETRILGKNQLLAERNRGWLNGKGILALNLVSSPGAGKTTLLERTLNDLRAEVQFTVVEGDQATSNDAERIRATGVRAVQINTGTGCHLEADMLERAMKLLAPAPNSLMMIENVGNLVCPALFDLGERAKVVIFSVTEGEDKPLKYPHMFSAATVAILSKIDLLPHVRFDAERAVANALTINPRLQVFAVSSYSGEGMEAWYGWLKAELAACMAQAA